MIKQSVEAQSSNCRPYNGEETFEEEGNGVGSTRIHALGNSGTVCGELAGIGDERWMRLRSVGE